MQTTEKEKSISKEEIENAKLLVPRVLKAINEKTGQEYQLTFADNIDYDEKGQAIVYYTMIG